MKVFLYGALGALVYALSVGHVTGSDLMVAFYWAAGQVEFALHLAEAIYDSVR